MWASEEDRNDRGHRLDCDCEGCMPDGAEEEGDDGGE